MRNMIDTSAGSGTTQPTACRSDTEKYKLRNEWVPIKENRCESIHLVDVLPLKEKLGFRSSGTNMSYLYSILASPDKRFPIKKETVVD